MRFGNVQGEIWFKLDRFLRGPYCIYTVITTCAHINPNNKLDDDMIMVSPQHLSHCWGEQLIPFEHSYNCSDLMTFRYYGTIEQYLIVGFTIKEMKAIICAQGIYPI